MRNAIQRARHIVERGGLSLLAERGYRYLTANRRAVPNVLIIGAKKGGTTSLWMYLREHPQIAWAERKEIRFFSCNYSKGTRWYRMNFPLRTDIQKKEEQVGAPVIVGGCGVNYLCHPLAPERVADLIPDVKVIALLRDPVERARSDYFHARSKGKESATFSEAMRRELDRTEEDWEALRRNGECPPFFQHQSYLYKGLYALQLDRWMQHFDQEQILILKSTSFFEDTEATFETVCRYLSINHVDLDFEQRYNSGTYAPKEHEEIMSRVSAFYEEPNKKLREKYGIDFC